MPAEPQIETNKRIVRDYLAAGNRQDWDAQLDLLDAEHFRLQLRAAAPLGYVMTYDQFHAMLRNIGEMMQSFHVEIDTMTAEDDRVAVQANSVAVTADGKEYRNQYHFLFTLREGRIVKIDEYLCSLTLSRILDPQIWESAKSA